MAIAILKEKNGSGSKAIVLAFIRTCYQGKSQ